MIEIKNVTITLKKNKILQNINLTIKHGYCYGLIGRNGSGKSVLFKAIAGFLPIDSGTILVDNQTVQAGKFIKNAGILIESPNFISNMSAFNNLKCLTEIKQELTDEEIEAVLKIVGLEEAMNQKYKRFSLGMKQRLRIAQAIMEEADYYILDEPFNGLDEEGVQDIYAVLTNLKKAGKTILLTSHDKSDIDTLCDYVYRVNKGDLHEEKN